MLVYKRQEEYYFNIPVSFDIEVSSFKDEEENKQACMYAYVLGLYGRVFVGRNWNSFIKMYELLISYFKPNQKEKLIIYVHNLSYEFQFIRKRFEWLNVFALDTRQVCYATTKDGVQFRCSYILSGYSLKKVGENLQKYKISKLSGDLNYKLIRHSKTPLTSQEWCYIFNDGSVVLAYIMESIETNKNSIAKIPLTNTGYVRRYIRNNCYYEASSHKVSKEHKYSYYRKMMKTLSLSVEEYKLARLAYQGGFTHANALWQGDIIDNVTSMDFTSSYPSVIILEDKFPMSKGVEVHPTTIEEFNKYVRCYCCTMELEFHNLKAKPRVPDHPLSFSHCYGMSKNHINDNGRVVQAESFVTYLTEIDFNIIKEYYTFEEFKVRKMFIYRRGYLPYNFVKGVIKLYKDKTSLKGVNGKEVEYLHSKGMLNATYGMMVTDIARDTIKYSDDEWSSEEPVLEEVIEKYNTSQSRFTFYLWGVYVSALARRNLFNGISNLGTDYIYSDTDSVKFINYEQHKAYFDSYNNMIQDKINKASQHFGIPITDLAPLTIKNESKPIGVWDFDGSYKKFTTLGAKRYCSIDEENKLHITISGVSKSDGQDYLMRKYQTSENAIKHFNESLNFPSHYIYNNEEYEGSGKNIHTYIDDTISGEVTDYLGVKSKYLERSSVYMEATSYDMSIGEEYAFYLKDIKEFRV